jgi:hypothetical protein
MVIILGYVNTATEQTSFNAVFNRETGLFVDNRG